MRTCLNPLLPLFSVSRPNLLCIVAAALLAVRCAPCILHCAALPCAARCACPSAPRLLIALVEPRLLCCFCSDRRFDPRRIVPRFLSPLTPPSPLTLQQWLPLHRRSPLEHCPAQIYVRPPKRAQQRRESCDRAASLCMLDAHRALRCCVCVSQGAMIPSKWRWRRRSPRWTPHSSMDGPTAQQHSTVAKGGRQNEASGSPRSDDCALCLRLCAPAACACSTTTFAS